MQTKLKEAAAHGLMSYLLSLGMALTLLGVTGLLQHGFLAAGTLLLLTGALTVMALNRKIALVMGSVALFCGMVWLMIGGAGVIGTSTHFTGRRTHEMIDAFCRGDVAEALRLHRALLPIFTGVFATQGCMMVKAGLAHQGLDVGACRPPLQSAPAELAEVFFGLLDAADL